jgi:hypothetical protein
MNPSRDTLVRDLNEIGGFAANQHGASWNPQQWEEVLGSLSGVPAALIESRHITREDLHELGAAFRLEPTPAFVVAVMAWGYGEIGYGAWRTSQAMRTPGALDRIYTAVATACSDGAAVGYHLLAAPGRPKWLGPAFGTKLICFGAYRAIRSGPRPVILDFRVAQTLDRYGWHFAPERWQHADRPSHRGYGSYIGLVENLADALACSPEDVEYRLWLLSGSDARSMRAPASAARRASPRAPSTTMSLTRRCRRPAP